MSSQPAKDLSSEQNDKLSDFRARIDAIDDKLVALLAERINIVAEVGQMKRSVNPGHCPLRPGREADMVRRIAEKFKDTNFSPAAAAAMWRILIGASTAVENKLDISVYAPEGNDSLYWMAREYFGPFLPITRQLHINRVVGDVMNGETAVGLVPDLSNANDDNWWTSLLGGAEKHTFIFAQVPFVQYDVPGRRSPPALAIGRIKPEATAEDVSIIALEADHNVSQNRVQTALVKAKLEAQWVAIAAPRPDSRIHLLKINGFIDEKHKGLQGVLAELGKSILKTYYLGAYAVPFTLKFDPKRDA